MKQSMIYVLIAVGWIILLNSLILRFITGSKFFSGSNMITGAAATRSIELASQTIGKIMVPLIVFNVLMVALLIVGYKVQIKNNKIKFDF